jgi:glycosyltransferase involved in cell wall biosynthesis
LIDGAPRFLFVPVSGAFGMGEYARSLAIAKGVAGRWSGASIQFILSREAPYAAGTPFPATLLASSPTFHSAAVIDVIEQWRPDVVIFDNAGRTAQLRAAKRCGARVVYISARRRQRGKAFRLQWMHLIDEHWIAYPEFIAGSLNFFERLKLDFLGRPTIRYLDVILDSARRAHEERAPGRHETTLARFSLVADDYALVVPGGGTGHPGARDAIDQFFRAAGGFAATGIDTIFVGREQATSAGGTSRLRVLGSLPQTELVELMRGARLIIANGGSTLLQSIACGKPCIAAPIAGDQSERIRRCVNAGVAVAAALDSASIMRTAMGLWGNASQLEALAGRSIALGLADGVEVALRALNALLQGHG